MLSIRHLHVNYRTPRGIVKAVQDVSFDIQAGEFASIVGESGSGKSSVAKCISRLLDTRHHEIKGEILIQGENVLKMNANKLRNLRRSHVGYVFQDAQTALNPLLPIRRQIEDVQRKRDPQFVQKALQDVQLLDYGRIQACYPHELSGGMKQRVMIAMALAKRPELLIADEATTGLDSLVQQEIMQLFRKVQQENNLALLFITHDLNLALRMSHRILVMKGGRIVETLTQADGFCAKESYTQTLMKGALLNLPPKTLI